MRPVAVFRTYFASRSVHVLTFVLEFVAVELEEFEQ